MDDADEPFSELRSEPVPAGTRVVADASLRRLDGGRMLVGGVGLRIVRLSEQGAAVVAGWLGGAPVGEGTSERALARRLLNAGLLHPVVARGHPDEITVVVPFRSGNRRPAPGRRDTELLEQLLKRLQGIKTVVVDDGSQDVVGVRETAERFGADLLRRSENAGPGRARNDGLSAVSTPFVAFVDVDTECSAEDLARLAGHFADDVVVAAAPRVACKPGTSLLARYEAHFSPLDLGDAPASVASGRAVSYVPSAVLVARAEALRAVGGFDPQLRYGEDVDLVWRLAAAGGTVRYEPEVTVSHLPRRTWAQWLRQRYDYGSAAAPLGRRHGRSVAPARCSAASAAVWALFALRRPADAVAAGARSLKPLAEALEGTASSRSEALKLTLRGHAAAGRGLAVATGRAWWPLALALVLTVRRLRFPAAGALLAGPALEYAEGRRPADPLTTVGLRALDQAAYGAGVWRGMLTERSVTALVPELVGNRVRRLEQADP